MPEPAWKLGILTGVAQVLADTQDGLMGTDQRVFDGIMVPERKADHRAAGR